MQQSQENKDINIDSIIKLLTSNELHNSNAPFPLK